MFPSWELWLWSSRTTVLRRPHSFLVSLSGQFHFPLIVHISVLLIYILHVILIISPFLSSLHLSRSFLYLFLGSPFFCASVSKFSPSFCVSDMCIIAPSGWWLAMRTPPCLQGFIYTRIPWLLETPGWDRWWVSTNSSWPTMNWMIKDMWVKELHLLPPSLFSPLL